MTGFNEPNALAVIANDGSGDNHIFHLYVREKDARAELWDGARSGTQAAVDVFNADEVSPVLCIAMSATKERSEEVGLELIFVYRPETSKTLATFSLES